MKPPDGEAIANISSMSRQELKDAIEKDLKGNLIKTMTVWDSSCKLLDISFSPDGKMLASASTDGTIILWNLNLDELLVQGCNWLRDYLKTNPNVSESERHLCDGIGTQK